MRALVFSALGHVFPISLVEGSKAQVSTELKWRNFVSVSVEGKEPKEFKAKLPYAAEAEALKAEGYEVRTVLLVPITFAVYMRDPPEDVNSLRRDVVSFVRTSVDSEFDEVRVVPVSGHFRLTVSGLPVVVSSHIGNARYEVFYTVRSESLGFKPDLIALDTTFAGGQLAASLLEGLHYAVLDAAFLLGKEVKLYTFSAEMHDDHAALVRNLVGYTGRLTPKDVRLALEEVQSVGRVGGSPIEARGRSLFAELRLALELCSPLYFAQRALDLREIGAYNPDQLEAYIWDNARAEKRAEYSVSFGASLFKGAVTYSVWRDVVDAINKSLGEPPYSLNSLSRVLELMPKACSDAFVKEVGPALSLVSQLESGREEYTLGELKEALRRPLAEVLEFVKSKELDRAIRKHKRECPEAEWGAFGLLDEAVTVTRGGKLMYSENCWKNVIKAFREASGLAE
ncbi:MAG: hypothetical protein ACP5HQ_01360 [Thermoprotei archaeon]